MNTLTKKTTLIGKTRQKNASQLDTVCELLGWTQMQYCNHQFDEYTAFVAQMFSGWPAMTHQVMYHYKMRGFWNNESNLRNEINFLPFAANPIPENYVVEADGELYPALEFNDVALMDEYLFIHSHMSLINDDLFMAKYNNMLCLIRKEGYDK